MKRLLIIFILAITVACNKNPNTYNNETAKQKILEKNYIKSTIDYNKNGIDDYSDILIGAKKDAVNHPEYDGSYVDGGYPPDNKGVCTDLVWRAFKEAGYNLKDMIDADISRDKSYYHIEKPDPNIDFRRVPNLDKFFKKYAVSLTTDINDYDAFNPGDIITYLDKPQHIGIVSDIKNKDGRAYLIHNAGQSERENDNLDFGKISGHYRFDSSKINPEILKPYN
ncbi:DUF1287 domain-containing protein [Peptoniphilus mikwangii]|uniref:DUF1287 domain-containing protein n=1 Tax=Peptoniphilus mikwangii TaxID=1354300 RepID=UPI0003FECCFE|nr:DUF1287 domain-containing protein [Peptoniphilus mikwangii]